ncbi:3-oxoacyl-[acyl-carrier-protein] reductase FabG [Abditibacteriota bacterium]|nr:3-oxoacyl-[acyl-carrier-protein] reductase FabG [Abditibacteriota bacterium]
MSKIALITGANKGIGLETARQLARDHGFTVLVGARDAERGNEAVEELKAQGLDAQFLAISPTDADSVAQAAKEVEDKYGHLDVLINNAGTGSQEDQKPPSQVALQVFRDIYEINVFGVHSVTQAFWPLLEKSEAARLVVVSSALASFALHTDPNGPFSSYKPPAYDSSKAAVNMLTVHYAHQWQDTPHRANTIHPGSVVTDLNPNGEISVEEGAKTSVDLATIGADGPNGGFFHLGQKLPW